MSKGLIGFSLIGSVMTIAFLWIVNLLTSPDTMWFITPSFFLILWPCVLLFVYHRRKYKQYSLLGSLLVAAYFVVINYLYSPEILWFLFAVYPVIWWPIATYAGRRASTLRFALIAALCTIGYYGLLNLLMFPQYPWVIYPAYAVLWWPISLYYARQKDYFMMSITGSLVTILFLIIVNIVSSPQTIWAVYPTFGILWWPLSMYYFSYRKSKTN